MDEKADRIQRSSELEEENEGKRNMNAGILVLVLGIFWFVIGIAFNRVFFMPLFMIAGGIISMLRESSNHKKQNKKFKKSDHTLDEII